MDMDPEPSTPTRKPVIYQSVVPWQSPEQFIKVYNCLYSPSVSDQRWAVNQISVWETRCHPSLPTAIEATVFLVRAFIQDILWTAEKTFCDETDIQMLFAIAIVRFVNLTLEIDQNSEFRINLKALAEKRNIPSWLLHLRHEVTHAFLPSLPMLRMGARAALTYLEESFWKVESVNIRPIVLKQPAIEEVVRNVITKYKTVQICILLGIGDKQQNTEEACELIREIRSLAEAHRQKFVDAFVQPDVFLCAKDIVQLVEGKDGLFLDDDMCAALPDVLEYAWRGVLKIFHRLELVPYFIEALLLSQENHSNLLCKKAAAVWATFLLDAALLKKKESNLAKRFQATGVQLNLYRLLYASMKGGNKYTYVFFTRLLRQLDNPEKFKDVSNIMALYQGVALEEELLHNQVIEEGLVFTLEDVEADVNFIKEKNTKWLQNQKGNRPKWSMAPVGMNFADKPIGAIINTLEKDEPTDTSMPDVDMDTSIKEVFVHSESYHQEPTIEENIELDINIFMDPEVGDMLYRM